MIDEKKDNPEVDDVSILNVTEKSDPKKSFNKVSEKTDLTN